MWESIWTSSLTVGLWQFLAVLLFIFGLFMILAGAFTAYFGSGRSRTIGTVLVVVGLAVGLGFGWYYSMQTHALTTLLWQAFLVLIAAVIGALVAIGIFLVAIMKS